VYPERMRTNMEMTYGLYNSQRLMLKLIEKGLNREDAYDLVQPLAMRAWNEQRPFRAIVLESEDLTAHLSEDTIDEAFDPSYHVRNVDLIFERVGLSD